MRYNEGTLDGLLIGAVMGITINALLLTIGFYSADNFVTFSILWAVVGVVVGAIRARKFRTVYDVRGGAACGFWIGAVFSIFYIAALFMAEAPIAPMITAMITIVFVHTIFTVAIGAAMGAILGMAKGMRQSEAKVPLVLRIIFAILFVIAVFLTVVIATAVGTPASMALVSAILIMAIDGIILYLAVPLVWWLIAHRKKVKFFAFVGISRPRFGGSKRTALVFAAVFVSAYTLYVVFLPESLAERNYEYVYMFAGLGFAALSSGLIYTYVTILCYEALFRGFVLGRLKGRIGLWPAVMAQAALAVLVFNAIELLFGGSFSIAVSVLVAAFGIASAVLNEKVFSGGSVIPSTLLIGTVDFVAVMLAAFAT